VRDEFMVETLQQALLKLGGAASKLLKAQVNRGCSELLQKSTIDVAFDKAMFLRRFTAK
jgi:hypothetical protein